MSFARQVVESMALTGLVIITLLAAAILLGSCERSKRYALLACETDMECCELNPHLACE